MAGKLRHLPARYLGTNELARRMAKTDGKIDNDVQEGFCGGLLDEVGRRNAHLGSWLDAGPTR